MKKVLLLMVAIMVIGGMVLVANPVQGNVSATGSSAVTDMTTGAKSGGASITAVLDLTNANNDLIEIGFASNGVTSDGAAYTPTVIKNDVALTRASGAAEATNSTAVNAYWKVQSATSLDVMLSIPAPLKGDGGQVAWKATAGTGAGSGAVASIGDIEDDNTAVKIADHVGTNYSTIGSVPLTLTTVNLGGTSVSGSVSGTVVVTVVADVG